MWQEKWLVKEEGCRSGDSSSEDVSKVTPTRGEDNRESGTCNPGSGNYHPELDKRNPDSGKSNPGKENDRQWEELVPMDINMVFMILAEFCALIEDVAELALGAERAMFEKPENPGVHMKPLFIRGHLERTPIEHMLIDGGASINILPLSLFMKLGRV
jgi:hypothetical protein